MYPTVTENIFSIEKFHKNLTLQALSSYPTIEQCSRDTSIHIHKIAFPLTKKKNVQL